MGLLLVSSYTQGISAMYGSTQGEAFFKVQSSTRMEAEEHIVMWKFIPLQLSLHFGSFPTLEQCQRHNSSSSHPNEPWSGRTTITPFWLQMWLRAVVVPHPHVSRKTERVGRA